MRRFQSLLVVSLVIMCILNFDKLQTSLVYNFGGVLSNKAFLGEMSSRYLDQAEFMFSSTLRTHPHERAYMRLGQIHFRLEEFTEAERAFNHAILLGSTDTRGYLWLADSLILQGKRNEAVLSLLDLLAFKPTEVAALDKLASLYSQTRITFADRTGWTDVPHGEIAPGQSIDLTLSLPAIRPRWLKIFYFDHPERNLTITADGQLIGKIQGQGGDWSELQFLVPVASENTINIKLENTGSSEFALTGLQLEYVANIEWFSDVLDASWTDLPHKALAPNESFETYIYLKAMRPRTITVNFFNFPDRHLVVLVDGVEVGKLTGGQLGSGSPGFTDFSFPIPDTSGSLMKVTLINPSLTQGTAFRYIAVSEVEK